jgi:hypothetical protein
MNTVIEILADTFRLLITFLVMAAVSGLAMTACYYLVSWAGNL